MLRVLKQYFPIRNALFFTLEGGVIFLSFLISSAIITISPSYYFDAMLILRIVFVTLVCQLCLYYNDLYDFDMVKTLPEMAIRLLQSLGAASILLAFVYFLFPLAIINQLVFILSILLLILFVTGWRLIYLNILNKGFFNEKIIILGSSELSLDIIDRIKNTIDCGYQISSVYPDSDKDIKSQVSIDGLKFNYNIEAICQTAVSAGVKKIVTVLKEQRGAFPMKQLIQCRTLGIEIIDGCSFYEQLTGKVLVQKINPSWLVFSEGFKKSALRNFLKRTQDVIGSLVLLVLLSPFLVFVAVLIKMDSKGPVLFAQDRVGRNRKEFMMHKFRSMVHDAEKLTG
ncbi:MAG: sugar transferase, partial [Thermodesulfobacteriota bacterium]